MSFLIGAGLVAAGFYLGVFLMCFLQCARDNDVAMKKEHARIASD